MRHSTHGSRPSPLLALGAGAIIAIAGAGEALAQSKNTPRPVTPQQRTANRAVPRGPEEDFQTRMRQLRDEQRQALLRKQAGDPTMDEELARIRTEINELTRQMGEQGAFGQAAINARDAQNTRAEFNAPGGDPADEDGANRGELANADGTVELAFPGGALPLDEFVRWVQTVLDINIIAREEIRGQEVLFFAPLSIPTEDLLPLLSALLEKEGYALVENELGWYDIVQAVNLPPVFDNKLITTQVIPTPLIQPSRLQQVINEALGGIANQVRVSAIDDLGILLVTGTPNRVHSVSEIVKKYLEERQKIELYTHQFEAVSAEYGRTRMLALNDRLAQAGGGGQPGQVNTGAGSTSVSNLSQNLILDQGNRIIFRGRPDEWAFVKALAERVDIITSLKPKRYVVGAELAEQIANAGKDLGLGPVRQNSGSSLFGNSINSNNRGFGGGLGQQSDEAALASGFVLDANAGAFTYFGTSVQQEMVDGLVKQYREQSENTRATVEIYKLHHMRAEDMAALLEGILEDPSQNNQFSGSPFIPGQRNQIRPIANVVVDALAEGEGDANAGGEGEGFITATADTVNIQFDESNNLIVVRATPRNQSEIERIIDQLDQRLPQVLIEAQIVSVTVNEDFSFSADVQLSAGQFDFLSSFGVTTPGATLQDPVTVPGTSIGPGLTSGLFRSDFVPIAIQALETVGHAKLVSNPRILVNDNTDAEVVSNEVRPFSSTTQGTATTVTSQGGTAEAGTQLTVTPRISAGGYINLEYEIELSAFIGQGQGGLQPPQQTENYSSEVTIPSDSTIIVGGFVSTTDSEDESKVPLLGDIPIIGNLFKSVSTQKVKRMIFVFITPRILDDPNFRDLRLATEGPLKDVELDGIVPNLEPAMIPITSAIGARDHRVAPAGVSRSDLLLHSEMDLRADEQEPGE